MSAPYRSTDVPLPTPPAPLSRAERLRWFYERKILGWFVQVDVPEPGEYHVDVWCGMVPRCQRMTREEARELLAELDADPRPRAGTWRHMRFAVPASLFEPLRHELGRWLTVTFGGPT